MNKKVNTVLFMLGATLYNLILLVVFILVGLAAMGALLQGKEVGAESSLYFMVIFALALGASFFIYHQTMKFISKKIDFEKHFDPIIKPRGRKRR